MRVPKVLNQYSLLMWKNLLLLSRSPFRIFVEIVWPITIFLILYGVRTRDTLLVKVPPCHLHNKPMPSAGLVPFFQGIMCTSDNKCNVQPVLGEISGRLTSLQTTTLERLIDDIAAVLTNDTQSEKLIKGIQEASDIFTALQRVRQENLADILGMNETSFYNTLESANISLSNYTVDLLFRNITLKPEKIVSELQRIQAENPEFIPLVETLSYYLINLQGVIANESSLWASALSQDFVDSLEDIPGLSLAENFTQAASSIDVSEISIADIIGIIQTDQSIQDRQRAIVNYITNTSIPQQIQSITNLTSDQRDVLTNYCTDPTHHETSACLLSELVYNTTILNSTSVLTELCEQTRYSDLLTCQLWSLSQVSTLPEADNVAAIICTDGALVKNSTLCVMYEIQNELREIIYNVSITDGRKVLCDSSSRIFDYDSPEVEAEVQPKLCNLTNEQLAFIMETIFEHVNLTASMELFFPDGLNFTEIFEAVSLFEELYKSPSVQKVLSDLAEFQNQSISAAICGDSGNSFIPSQSTDINSTDSPSSTTARPNTDKPEYVNTNSTEYWKRKRCDDLFSPLKGSDYGELVFNQLEPILFGKIPYSPQNNLTLDIIRQANSTFQSLANIKAAANDIRNQYKTWMATLSQVANRLMIVDELFNLTQQGPRDLSNYAIPLITPEQFQAAVLNFTANNLNALPGQPTVNLTQMIQQLGDITQSLQENGTIWNQLDGLGQTTTSVYDYLDCVELDKFEPLDTEFKLENRSLALIKDNKFWAGVVFQLTSDDMPTHLSYKIRMNTDKVDSTDRFEDKYWRPGARSTVPFDTKYITFGFAYIQDMVEHSIIELMTGVEQGVGIYLQQFPFPCFTRDDFTRGISRTVPLFLVLSWIFSVALLIKSIVYEKQERLKEQMKIMGLSDGIHWAAWYSVSLILILPSIVILIIIFKYGKVLAAADSTIIFLFLFSFSFSTACQAFLFSVFFSRANLAACCGAILYFTLYLPYSIIYQFEQTMPEWQKGIACLLSPVALGMGSTYIARYEEQGVGISFDNINQSPLPDDTFSLAKCIGFMFLDGVIYFFLAWYKEHVFPGRYGVPKPFYFLFTRKFWCGPRPSDIGGIISNNARNEMSLTDRANFEEEPRGLKLGVKIENLTKYYTSGNKLAVDDLSLNLYEDQITSFLGHNGAGKTTTMSVLCGLFPPTNGNATIYENSIITEMDTVRGSLGFCPQYNVLFEELTVAEHILFYGQLKGLTETQAKQEMEQMTKAVGLHHKLNELTKNLSGGMKRKVSVMCAFVGDSKCVILDEPTAGVDPYSRRQIWDLLLKFKTGRTILLSTHHMDEADFLGDRIAIISQGKLRCSGSSLFLKALHGNGYYLTLVRERVSEASAVKSDEYIDEFVKSRVPGAVMLESQSTEIAFQLPSKVTGDFVKLFQDLDSNLLTLGLSSYGISDTTLEEIFLKVADQTGVDTEEILTESGKYPLPVSKRLLSLTLNKVREKIKRLKVKKQKYQVQKDDNSEVDNSGNVPSNNIQMNGTGGYDTSTDDEMLEGPRQEMSTNSNGNAHAADFSTNRQQIDLDIGMKGDMSRWALLFQQVMALVIKRFNHIRRDKWAFVCEIVLPAIFIALAMAFALAVPPIEPMPPLVLQPWIYQPKRGDPHLNTFYSNDYPNSQFTRTLDRLVSEGEYGTRCLDPSVYEIEGKSCELDKRTMWSVGDDDIYPDCDCQASGYQQCEAIKGRPSSRILPNTDRLHNLTGSDISDWIIKTMEPNIKRRYGGFSLDVAGSEAHVNVSSIDAILDPILIALNNRSLSGYNDSLILAHEISQAVEDVLDLVNINENIKVWFNNKGWASSVSYMNAANNMILKSRLLEKNYHRYSQYGITAINHPMNRTDYQLLQKIRNRGYVTVLISLCVIFAMSLIPATFVLYMISDRVSTSKDLQFVSGMNRVMYWVTNFMWDMFNYTICCSLCFLIFLAFNEKAYVSKLNGPCLALLIWLYGWSMTPLMYLFHWMFKETSMAYVVLGCINIFIGIVSTVSTYILELFPGEPELNQIGDLLKQVFLIFPHFCLGRGLIDISVKHLEKEIYELLNQTRDYDPFSWNITGRNMLCMFIFGLVYFIIVVLIELRMHATCKRAPGTDYSETRGDNIELEEDVEEERQTVLDGGRPGDVLKVQNLNKIYSGLRRRGMRTYCNTNHAVRNLSFGVPRGQCFGLLGVNGAGKTTTFKMLTGIGSLTSGDAKILDKSILTEGREVQRMIGYCPQFDALDPLLTGREHLEFYARIRGIPRNHVKKEASSLLKKMGLVQYQDKLAGNYSGGNKRKLQAAIALIGRPPVIYLDEPTTGMDPRARRFLWDMILKIVKEGHAVILTSHSMEECEILCDRLGIMVNGTFQCMGTTTHLKNKYGEGYHVVIRARADNSDMSSILHDMDTEFHTDCQLLESSHSMAQYHVQHSVKVSEIFEKLEKIKSRGYVEDYSLTQTSLDHVFIRFARNQTDDEELPNVGLLRTTSQSNMSYTTTNSQAPLTV